MEEREKFLDEWMGESLENVTDPWARMGKRWLWAQEQPWFSLFLDIYGTGRADFDYPVIQIGYILPGRFEDALYRFLKKRTFRY